ncbi:putative pre-16S rRNA nuclease [Bacteroidia bacterium]|nr:putative pre-16S rRNA nuclease [Bacteroidia bacterium]
MGRILAIDYGARRTGIAVSDPLKLIAGGLDTVSTATLIPYLKDYLAHNEVETIVVGKPLQLNGQPSQSYPAAEALMHRLGREFPGVAMAWCDERFTSVLAHRTMIESGIGRQKRRDKALVDRISATIILQSYMESKQ